MASMTTTVWDKLRRSPGTALAVVLVAVFILVAAVTRSGDSPTTLSEVTLPTSQTAPGGAVPEPLDRAIKSLEEAVSP